MNQLATTKRAGLPTQFHPETSGNKQAQADAIIEYARRIRDWPLLEQAVEAKIEEQAEFVAWWDEHVGINHGGDRKNIKVTDTATLISADDAERLTGFDKMRVSRIRKRLKDPSVYRQQLYGAAWKKAFPEDVDHNHRAQGTGENEWYTPSKYVEMARQVMGTIDLDPATSDTANIVVRAEKIYTAKDDGLNQKWHGRVWMNPPYSQPAIQHFIEKLADSYLSGDVEQAIALTHNYTDTAWFHIAANACSAVCFTRGRIGFLSPSGERAAPTQGQAFFYFGKDVDAFAGVFMPAGFVMVRPGGI
jgi:phage N-6-adenine-methyltransferase